MMGLVRVDWQPQCHLCSHPERPSTIWTSQPCSYQCQFTLFLLKNRPMVKSDCSAGWASLSAFSCAWVAPGGALAGQWSLRSPRPFVSDCRVRSHSFQSGFPWPELIHWNERRIRANSASPKCHTPRSKWLLSCELGHRPSLDCGTRSLCRDLRRSKDW